MDIALIGPPGAGKGTHAEKIVAQFSLRYVSTGELLRENLERQTGLGAVAQTYMDQGEAVPGEIVDAMMVDFLGNVSPEQGLLFNGFPRTAYQAHFLDQLFEKMGRCLDAVIYLKASDDEILKRLSKRLICDACQAPFHKTFHPFETCPYHTCQGEHLYRRQDDTPKMALLRLRAFHRATKPLIDYYHKTDRLVITDGEGAIKAIDQAIAETVEAVQRHEAQPATHEEAKQIQALNKTVTFLSPVEPIHPSLDIVFLGPPGAGKGTQAAYLAQQLNIPRIATGDLFRENIKIETPLGKVAKTYMDHGKLVPDDVTEAMVRERLARADVLDGFILDGFPRNLPQAETLAEIITVMGRWLAAVFYLNVADEEIINRLSGRTMCRACQTPFHTLFNPFKTCPHHKCQGEHLYQRDDDKPDTVQARLQIYHGETEPLVEYYRKTGLLTEIDGKGDLGVVREKIMAVAQNLKFRQNVSVR